MEKRTCSRTRSAGERFTQGTSARRPRQVLLARHRKFGSQPMPASSSTTRSPGNSPNTPSYTRLSNCPWNTCACPAWSSAWKDGQPVAVGGWR